jgi:hypothetical protein
LFTSKRYPQGREKQAVCAASIAFLSYKNAMSDLDENFDSAGLHVEHAD